MARNDSFSTLFSKNEYRALAGTNNRVTLLLTVLVSVTFTALGFAIGGREQLAERMDNPFTRWVDFTVNQKAEKQFKNMNRFLADQETQEAFYLEGFSNWTAFWVYPHKRNFEPTAHPIDSLAVFARGRTVEYGNQLYEEILNEASDNLVQINDAYFNDDDEATPLGIIVTTGLLERLDYAEEDYAGLKKLSINVNRGRDLVFVDVLAIVRSLPSKAEFMSNAGFYNIVQGDFNQQVVSNSVYWRDTSKIWLLGNEEDQEDAIIKDAAAFFTQPASSFLSRREAVALSDERKYQVYLVSLPVEVTVAQSESWVENLKKNKGLRDHSFLEWDESANTMVNIRDFQTFNFSKLDAIREFQETLDSKFGLRLPMELVENRENFRLVADLTSILSVTLFCFGLIAILLYTVNLINNHVDKIRPHLGTFKAMGLSNGKLMGVYTKIATRLLLTAGVLGLPLAWLIGTLSNKYLLGVGFKLFHLYIFLAVGILLAVVILQVIYRLRKVFNRTPGDLIYERE